MSIPRHSKPGARGEKRSYLFTVLKTGGKKMITDFMIWEITFISILTGMLLGFIIAIVALKIQEKLNTYIEKSKKQDAIDRDLAVAEKISEKDGVK